MKKTISRRTFVAAAAAAVAAPAQMLAAVPPVGSILAAAGITFVRGAAIPAGFDFRDPYSATLMALNKYYIQCEDGTTYCEEGFDTPEAAVEHYVQREAADRAEHLAWLSAPERLARPGGEKSWERSGPDQLQWYQEFYAKNQVRDDISVGEYNGYSVVHGEAYLVQLLTVDIPSNAEYDDGHGMTYAQEFEAAQNEPGWNCYWGGGG